MARPDWYDTPRGMPSTVPGNSGAASLRAAQGFNAAPGVSGYTAPVAPAAPLDLRGGGTGVNPTMPQPALAAAPAEPAPKVGVGRAIADGLRTTGSVLRTGAGYVGAGLKASTPMAIGAAAGAIQNKIDASVPEQAPFVPPESAPGGIPIDPNGPRGPAKIENHPLGFGPDNEFTRNLANTMNALPGTGPATNVLRSGSAAAKLLTAGENAAQVGTQVVRGAQAAPGYVPQPSAPPNTPQAADPRTATDWGSRPDVSAPAGPVGGTVNRVGNSFSGEDVKAGFGYTGDGRPGGLTPAQGGGGLRGGGTVTSLNMSEGHRQNLLELARLRDPNSSGAFVNGQFVQSPDSQLAAQRASVSTGDGGNTLGQGAVGFGPGGGGGLSGRRAERANAMAISAANNETQRLNNERTNQTTLRGQEMTYAGHMAPLQYQQGRMQLAGQYLRAAGGDPAKAFALASSRGDTDIAEHLGKTVSTMQGQAVEGNKLVDAKYDEVKTGMKGRFNFMDKEGQPKMSDAMEAQAYTRFRSAHPDFHNEPDQAKRQQMLRDHLGDEELAARFGAPKNGGYANLVPGFLSPNQPMLRQNGIPGDDLLVKGKIDTPYKGALLSPGIQSGDRFYDPGPGKSAVNMGDLSADALQRLNFHMQSAKQREANRLRN